MKVLSRAALAEIDVAHASPSARPIEILQIGEGVFLRGFVDWMVDVANEKGVFGGGVAVAAPRRHQRPPPLLDQDCLYTVLLAARAGGVDVAERRVVTAVQTALDPYTQWDAVRRARRLARAEVRGLQHDRSRNRRRSRAIRPGSLPDELSRESGGAAQGALRGARV